MGIGITTLDLQGRHVYAVDIGRNAWVTALVDDRHTRRAFAVLSDVFTPAYRVLTLDTQSGRLVAAISAPPHPTAAVVDERTGRVFVAAAPGGRGAGLVEVLDAHSGHVLGMVNVPPTPRWLAADEHMGRVYVASDGPVDANGLSMGRGTLSVLSAVDGTVLQTIPIAKNTTAEAIDPATRRVLITSLACVTGHDPPRSASRPRQASSVPSPAHIQRCLLIVASRH